MSKIDIAERLAKLKERDQKTRDEGIRLASLRDHTANDFKKFSELAIKEFGTDNLDELREIFTKSMKEDERAIQDYEESIVLREKLIHATLEKISKLPQSNS